MLGDLPDGPTRYSPPPVPAPDNSSPSVGGPLLGGGGGGGGIPKKKHSRGRSMTSKAEMMGRPNSAKARVDYVPQSTGDQSGAGARGGVKTNETRPGSPPAVVDKTSIATSPTHHKTATASGTGLEPDLRESMSSPHHRKQTRPHSTHFGHSNATQSSIPSAASASSYVLADNSGSYSTSSMSMPTTPSSLPMSSTSLLGVLEKEAKNKVGTSTTATPYPSNNNDPVKTSSQSSTNSPLQSDAPPSSLSIDGNDIGGGDGNSAAMASPSIHSPAEGVAPPSAATPPDGKPLRDTKEGGWIKESQSGTPAGNASFVEKEKDNRIGPRKGSEAPLSLQNLFRGEGIGSSRRWSTRQFSMEDPPASNAHPKQHSLDSTYLQSIAPQSPKYRRVKSPSVSDKGANSSTPARMEPSSISTTSAMALPTIGAAVTPLSGGSTSLVMLSEEETKKWKDNNVGGNSSSSSSSTALRRTPSHPHLNSGNNSPLLSRASVSATPESTHPIMRARSTQQLKMMDDAGISNSAQQQQQQQQQLGKSPWHKAGSHSDLTSTDTVERSGMKLLKGQEISQSKESLDMPREPPLEPGMKRIGSKESLKGKDLSKTVIQSPAVQKEQSSNLNVSMVSSVPVTSRDRERTTPLKDTQASAEGSVENMQATFTQVGRSKDNRVG